VVTSTLSPDPAGARVRLVHSSFRLPTNATALKNMGDGWRKIVRRLRAMTDEHITDAESATGGEPA
jgi:hypothetical protein